MNVRVTVTQSSQNGGFNIIRVVLQSMLSTPLVYKCLHGTAPSYLTDELEYTADFWPRRCLRSSSSLSLNVRRTRMSTVSDRAFPVAAAHTWNSLPQHVMSTASMSVFRGRLKAFLISRSFPRFILYRNFCIVPAK